MLGTGDSQQLTGQSEPSPPLARDSLCSLFAVHQTAFQEDTVYTRRSAQHVLARSTRIPCGQNSASAHLDTVHRDHFFLRIARNTRRIQIGAETLQCHRRSHRISLEYQHALMHTLHRRCCSQIGLSQTGMDRTTRRHQRILGRSSRMRCDPHWAAFRLCKVYRSRWHQQKRQVLTWDKVHSTFSRPPVVSQLDTVGMCRQVQRGQQGTLHNLFSPCLAACLRRTLHNCPPVPLVHPGNHHTLCVQDSAACQTDMVHMDHRWH
jgi:hypothetical protein